MKKSKPYDPQGLEAAQRVLAAGGRVPKKFIKAHPASAGPTLEAKQAQAKVTPARRVAFEILTLVNADKGHSDELLHGPRTHDLSEPDKHLATALVMGVLRWQIALDARLRAHLDRPGQKIAEPVLLALRLGALQLLHMDRIPPHAALSESVELARAAGHPHATGMVNAILRKLSAAPPPKEKIFETTAAFAERLGHPLWLVERWVAHYGREAALKICESDQSEPDSAGLFTPDESLPQIDPGSRLVAEITAAALPQIAGQPDARPARIWDTCAAPGGKTLIFSARHPAAQILATDISPKRLANMQARLRRYPYASSIKTLAADAATLPPDLGLFDLILCDVPCSGTGTLGRNPEIRQHLTPEELTRQSTRQRAILSAALLRLAPGGRLIYSTCSLEPEENEQVVASAPAHYQRIPIRGLQIPNLTADLAPLLQPDGTLRTLPGTHPCDGFYAAILQRPS